MKKLLLLTIIIVNIINSNIFGQFSCYIDFSSPTACPNIKYYRDTINNPNNIWQIGAPHKPYFASNPTVPVALMTDTINPYPINDTSYFCFKIWNHGLTGGLGYYSSFYFLYSYKVDSDSLHDYGFLEFSPDNGQTWYFLNDSLYSNCWDNPFAGYWHPFEGHCIGGGGNDFINFGSFCVDNITNFADTIMLQFGFISDSIFDNKEGLMIEYLDMGITTGLSEYDNNINIRTTPNPASDYFNIEVMNKNKKYDLKLIDNIGKIVFESEVYEGINIIPVQNYSNGLYFLLVYDRKSNIKYFSKIQIVH